MKLIVGASLDLIGLLHMHRGLSHPWGKYLGRVHEIGG